MLTTLNYFDLLALPESVELERAVLEHAYQALQSRWHPDRFAGLDAAARTCAVQQTSLLNDAYRSLREPVLRAAHLLTLRGLDPERLEQHELEPLFLLEQMTSRENLEECRAGRDAAALARLGAVVQARFKAAWAGFAAAFARNALLEAKREFHKLQFLNKLQHEISAAEALLDG
ncbi:MAG: Fe-S protein assembly co-chaperone HscB [Pseudomonadales bacterium]|jgi:molecular chaperone HscB|nr:Fe-S protein assembly co-chaperone HscB [Pseudomonadales bacterium]